MVSIQELSFAFKKGEPIFSGLNLDLQPGNIYGLFGLNGAGKTTLLNHITGMLFPENGRCNILGEPARKRRPEVLSEIFIVPEQFELPSITGFQYLDIHAPFYPRFDIELMTNMMKEFEINPRKKIPELSYGQQKKFLIAFAIATNCKLLLMDEPTNGLDIPSKSQFRKIQASLDNSSRCIVISTHQVRDLGAMIDHVTVIKDGKIIFNQPVEALQQRLTFKKIKSNATENYIYAEDTLGGMNAITPRKEHEETELDLELLFNGVIQHPERINLEFNTHSS